MAEASQERPQIEGPRVTGTDHQREHGERGAHARQHGRDGAPLDEHSMGDLHEGQGPSRSAVNFIITAVPTSAP